jgi:hypothetical protein
LAGKSTDALKHTDKSLDQSLVSHTEGSFLVGKLTEVVEIAALEVKTDGHSGRAVLPNQIDFGNQI